MRRIAVVVLILTFSNVNAQYFIPIFNSSLDKVNSAKGLFVDTVHNYLYVTVSYLNSNHNLDSSGVLAYRGNQFQKVGNVNKHEEFRMGAALSNGKCVVASESDYDYLYEINGLNMTSGFVDRFAVGNWLYCIKAVNDTAYFGGSFSKFTSSGGQGIGGIAPSGSFSFGGATNTVGGGIIWDIETFNGELYACGLFNSMNNSNSPSIARWNGSDWFPLGGGLTFSSSQSYGSVLEVFNGKLYVGGQFKDAGGISCNSLARWTGTNWENILEFKNDIEVVNFRSIKTYHNKLYIAGSYYDNFLATGLFEYDEKKMNNFYPLGGWFYGAINSMEIFHDTLFIAGRFDSIGYIPARKLAKFVDGTFSTYAPVTTKWWYNSSNAGQQANNSCYKYYEVARDTFVMNTPPTSGYNCRKIKAEQYLPNKTHTALAPLYVFGDTNRIMYYNNYQKRFVEGYKFNVKVGDTLTYYTPQPQSAGDTTFRVIVDSVTTLTVQTEKLKRVYTTPLDGWSFGNDGYAQLIGGLASMLPQPISYFTNEGTLLCYQDTSLYFKYFTGGVNCDYAVAVVTERKESKITISPNPSDGRFYLNITNLGSEGNAQVEVYDLFSRNVFRKTVTLSGNNSVGLELPDNITDGIYLLNVKSGKGNRFVKLIITKP